jgi:hypothetical protein
MGGFSNTDPQQQYNMYSSVMFGTPSAAYTPDFGVGPAQQGVSAASPISMQQPIQAPSPSLFAPPQNNQQMPAPAQRPVGIGMPMEPAQQFNQYSNVLFGTPPGGYTPNFGGTQAQQAPGAGDDVGDTISPQQQYNMYSNVLFGTPPGGYTPNFGAPAQRPVGIGMPMEPGQQQFRGGLRPAPRGYRPPGGLRQRMGR